jgi:hypothetical protein
MRITNTTIISDAKIRELIRFAKPSGISKFDVMLKNHSGSGVRGVAYYEGNNYHYSRRPFIVVAVQPSEEGYPRRCNGGKGYLSYLLLSRTEDVLLVLAHELRHLWQRKHPKGWRVWGARGQFSERDADAYGIRKVREYRKNSHFSTTPLL